MENLQKIAHAWTPTQTNQTWQKPAFARCKLNYNGAYKKDGTPNMDAVGYTPYFSLDWNNKTNVYDEMEGMRKLVENLILCKPPQATRWACLYINLTLDLDTTKYNYEHKIAYFVGHRNTMPKFKPAWMRIANNGLRIDITNTLLAVRELKEQVAMMKLAQGYK